MVFSSLEFIFTFLPIFLIVYFAVPGRYKNIILFTGSLCFYAFGEPGYILLLLLSLIINYIAARRIEYSKSAGKTGKPWFFMALFYNLGMLIFFKYINFIIDNINLLLQNVFHTGHINPVSIALPLGISFYTFQILSYLIDVYKEEIQAEKSLLRLGTYLCMFPQLISGPLVPYSQMAGQIRIRVCSLVRLEKGLKLFVIGLGLKVLIADPLGTLWNDIQTIGFESISTPLAWLGTVGYSLQLYFDFHGYTLMALGTGKMLGFTLPENFSHPYMSTSVTEFWRRWHMTLGQWFRNYIYIPMGGNRKGTFRLILNLFTVWAITGLWHGANWNFVLWGLSLFLLILLEKLFLKQWLVRSRILSRVYVLTVMPLTWMLFAIPGFRDIKIYFGRLFSMVPGINVNPYDFIKYFGRYKWLFLMGIFFSMPYAKRWYTKNERSIPCLILLLLVFWYSIYRLANSANNPFLYFRF